MDLNESFQQLEEKLSRASEVFRRAIAEKQLTAAENKLQIVKFLERVGRFPVGIVLRYDEILPLRRQRVAGLLEASYRILCAWPRGGGLRDALRACYARDEFESRLAGMLRLYAMETRALARAVRLPALLRPAQDSIGSRLYAIMDAQAARLAREAARSAFRGAAAYRATR